MKIIFWLYKSRINKKGLTPVIMRITLPSEKINFPVHITIEEKNWLKQKQEVKSTHTLADKYNQHLLTLKTKAWEYYNEQLKKGKSFTARNIKDYIFGNDLSTYTLLEAFDYQIKQLKAREGNDISPATVKKYETCKRKIQAFLNLEKNEEDQFLHQLNHQFISEFDVFMRVKQGLQNNGVIKNMQQLRVILKVAKNNEWMENDPFAKYAGKIIEPKRTFLTQEELVKLEATLLPSQRLNQVRDIFIFSCYTGLAYADMVKLSRDHFQFINGMDWIILDRTKTKNQSTIPLLPKAKEILDKYIQGSTTKALPVISSQNLNKYLKEVAHLAGLAKRLSFHAARHTFATTVTLNNGVDIATVSAMLGHKMIKTTQIYAKVNLNKIAADVKHMLKDGGE